LPEQQLLLLECRPMHLPLGGVSPQLVTENGSLSY